MNYQDIQTFLTITSCESLSKAAEQLYTLTARTEPSSVPSGGRARYNAHHPAQGSPQHTADRIRKTFYPCRQKMDAAVAGDTEHQQPGPGHNIPSL